MEQTPDCIFKVRLGEHDLSRDDDGAFPIELDIEERLIHSAYNPRYYHNDIGIIKVRNTFEFVIKNCS